MTIEMKPEDINRIAGRMAYRAHNGEHYINGLKQELAMLRRRDPAQDSGLDVKIDNLEARRDRLTAAITDYKKAERMIRAFPALLAAAKAGGKETKESLEAMGGCDHSVNICQCDSERNLEEIAAAVEAGEAALQ